MDSEDIIYTFPDAYSISYGKNYFCCVGRSAKLYNLKNGVLEFKFGGMKQPYYSQFVSDNRLIVKTTRGYYFIYDLESKALQRKLSPPKGVLGSHTKFLVTSDQKYIVDLAYIFPFYKLMFMDIETGEYTLYDLDNVVSGDIFYDEIDSEYYILTCHKNNDSKYNSVKCYSFRYPYKESELRRISIPDIISFQVADYHCKQIAVRGLKNMITILNLESGTQKDIPYEEYDVKQYLKWSINGKYIALIETRTIYIFDVASRKCIKTLDVDYGSFVDFYDNDSKLLVGTWGKGYCIDISHLFENT